ncbi:MAG: AraC family transcriptional regulator [Bacteroidota bacterium]
MALVDHTQTKQKQHSFRVELREHPVQQKGMHFHPEFQISLILSGKGYVRIANHEHSIQKGEILLVGPDLPHEIGQEKHGPHEELHLISIYFLPTVFGKHFFSLPEMNEIEEMLDESKRGIIWQAIQSRHLNHLFLSLRRTHAANRIIQLLALLNKLGGRKERQLLNPHNLVKEKQYADSTYSKIMNYIYQNFDKPISLEEMAELVNLNKYSFCRYFKRMTQMSFVSYLNEFRISKACSFLSSDTYNISQIGYLVGFNTLSNFYRQFQKVMNCTPTEYRQEMG